MHASIAVLALMLALWVLSYQVSNLIDYIKAKQPDDFDCHPAVLLCKVYTYSLGVDVTSIRLPCARIA